MNLTRARESTIRFTRVINWPDIINIISKAREFHLSCISRQIYLDESGG